MEQSAIANNIFAIRNHFGHTQEDFAKLLGVSQTTVSNWETSGHSVSNRNIKTIMDKLPVTRDDIVSETNGFSKRINYSNPSYIPGAHPVRGTPTVRARRVGRVHAGPAGTPDVYEDEDDFVEIPQSYFDIDPECVVVDFEGDCMLPDFGDATSLVVSPNSPFGNGSIVIASIDGADYVVRRMEQTARELRLKASNPAYDDIIISRDEDHEVDYKGKVLGCFKRFD